MDITTGFGPVVGGSNPSGDAILNYHLIRSDPEDSGRRAPIAQLVEQETLNLCVPGSSPGGGTLINKFFKYENSSRFGYCYSGNFTSNEN
jgi:hypothetical protein